MYKRQVLASLLASIIAISDIIMKLVKTKISEVLSDKEYDNPDVTTTVMGKDEVIYTPTASHTAVVSSSGSPASVTVSSSGPAIP